MRRAAFTSAWISRTQPLRFYMGCEVRHKNTDPKAFVVVILKEGLVRWGGSAIWDGFAGWGPADPSFGMAPTIKYKL